MSYFATFLVPEPENVRIDYDVVRFMPNVPCTSPVIVPSTCKSSISVVPFSNFWWKS